MNDFNYTETSPCLLCGFTENKPLFTENILLKGSSYSLGINECASCKLCYISPRLNINGLSLLYNDAYMDETISGINHVNEEVSELEYRQFVKYLNKELPQGGSVLDVGCGVGLMLDAIAKDCPNIKAEGVEFSSFAGEKARSKGHQVYIGDITQMEELKAASFDAIIILYVLEHVPDPIGVLNKCYSLLKENGKILIAVPNYRYLKLSRTGILARILYGKESYIHAGEHLFNYTPKTIAKILDKCGFKPYYYGQAKPLKAGSTAMRFIKSAWSGVFDILFKVGYQMGGIHIVATKNSIKALDMANKNG